MKNNEVNYVSIYKNASTRERGLMLSFPKSFCGIVKSDDVVIDFEKNCIKIREATILDFKRNKISKHKGQANACATTDNSEYYTGRYNFEKDGDIIYLTKIL